MNPSDDYYSATTTVGHDGDGDDDDNNRIIAPEFVFRVLRKMFTAI